MLVTKATESAGGALTVWYLALTFHMFGVPNGILHAATAVPGQSKSRSDQTEGLN
jgi:hypothetical protein